MSNFVDWPKIDPNLKAQVVFQEAAFVLVRDVKVLLKFVQSKEFDYYEMLVASSVMRRLLLDKYSLARQLAKSINFRLYIVRHLWEGVETEIRYLDLPDHYLHTMAKVFAPNEGSTCHVVSRVLSVDDYMKEELGVSGGHKVTPKLAIRFAANKLGGIHHDLTFLRSSKPEDLVFSDMYISGKTFQMAGKPDIFHFLKTVASDIFHCISPLGLTMIHNGVVSSDELLPAET